MKLQNNHLTVGREILVENLLDNINNILIEEELDYDGSIPLFKLFNHSF